MIIPGDQTFTQVQIQDGLVLALDNNEKLYQWGTYNNTLIE